MTKILSSKAAIPSRSGNFKDGTCDFNVIWNVTNDVSIYNFVDTILRKNRMGKLWDEVLKKEKNKSDRSNENAGADDDEGESNNAAAVDEDEDDETKKIDGIWPIEIGPDGIPLKRNPTDVLNIFFINHIVTSFTDLDQILNDLQNNGQANKLMKF